MYACRLGKVLSLGLDMTGNVVYSTAGAACGTLQALASLARHPLSSTTGASTQGLPATKAPAARLALPAVPTIPLQKPVTRYVMHYV